MTLLLWDYLSRSAYQRTQYPSTRAAVRDMKNARMPIGHPGRSLFGGEERLAAACARTVRRKDERARHRCRSARTTSRMAKMLLPETPSPPSVSVGGRVGVAVTAATLFSGVGVGGSACGLGAAFGSGTGVGVGVGVGVSSGVGVGVRTGVGVGVGAWTSPSLQTMMWLICLSPSSCPGCS